MTALINVASCFLCLFCFCYLVFRLNNFVIHLIKVFALNTNTGFSRSLFFFFFCVLMCEISAKTRVSLLDLFVAPNNMFADYIPLMY